MLSQNGIKAKTSKRFYPAENGVVVTGLVFRNLRDILTIILCESSVMLDAEIIVLGGPSRGISPQ